MKAIGNPPAAAPYLLRRRRCQERRQGVSVSNCFKPSRSLERGTEKSCHGEMELCSDTNLVVSISYQSIGLCVAAASYLNYNLSRWQNARQGSRCRRDIAEELLFCGQFVELLRHEGCTGAGAGGRASAPTKASRASARNAADRRYASMTAAGASARSV